MSDNEKNEKKVRSIRADEETYAKFREVCEQMGGQQEALNALISSYELETAKSVLSGQADYITDFKSRVDGIVRAYIQSLDMVVNAEERVGEDFKRRIESQAEIIEDLQNKNEVLSVENAELRSSFEKLNAECAAAVEKADNAIKMQEQTELIASMKAERVEQLEVELESMNEQVQQNRRMANSYQVMCDLSSKEKSEITKEFEDFKVKFSELERELEKERNLNVENDRTHKKELDISVKLAVAEVREKYTERIEQLQEKYQTKIEQLQEKYQTEVEQLKKENEQLIGSRNKDSSDNGDSEMM